MMSCDGVLNKTDPVWGKLPRVEAPNQFRQYRAQKPLFFTSLVLPSFNFLGVSCRNASCSSFCLISSVHPAHLHFSAGEEIEGSAPLLSTFACTDQRIPGCDPKQQCQSGSVINWQRSHLRLGKSLTCSSNRLLTSRVAGWGGVG